MVSVGLLRWVDKWVGIPLCFVLSFWSKDDWKEVPGKILFIKFWALGDSVLTLPMLKALKEKYPASQIDVLCTDRNKGVYVGQPFINKIVKFSEMSKKRDQYDLVIDGEPYLRISAILAWWFGKQRVGFNNQWARTKLYTMQNKVFALRHVVYNYLSLIDDDFKIPSSLVPLKTSSTAKVLVDCSLQPKDKIVGITVSVGASVKSRMWMPERWAETADWLIKEHHAKIWFFGSEEECWSVQKLMKYRSYETIGDNLALDELFEKISRLSLMISCDTGQMHIASAMGVPTIGLFGSNTPLLWSPYGNKNTAIYIPTDCSPCINNGSGIMPECKNNLCMQNINVKEIKNCITQKYQKLLLDKQRNITQIFTCPKCNSEVSFDNVSEGYTACCEKCDEDLYSFELCMRDIYARK